MLAIICAIRQEFDSLLKEVDTGKIASKNVFRICEARYNHKDILIVETGSGKKRAKRATESVLKDYPISGLASVGFAGGLDEGLAVGDLVLCRSLYCQTSNSKEYRRVCDNITLTPSASLRAGLALSHQGRGESSLPWREGARGRGQSSFMMRMRTNMIKCDSKWTSFTLGKAKESGMALKEGSSVSVRMPACDVTTKKTLAAEFPASVVEMESYWIARIARSRGIPFLCIRAISDALTDCLPPFDRLINADGSWRKGKAAWYFLPKPWRMVNLVLLYMKMKKAAESLTKSLEVI